MPELSCVPTNNTVLVTVCGSHPARSLSASFLESPRSQTQNPARSVQNLAPILPAERQNKAKPRLFSRYHHRCLLRYARIALQPPQTCLCMILAKHRAEHAQHGRRRWPIELPTFALKGKRCCPHPRSLP